MNTSLRKLAGTYLREPAVWLYLALTSYALVYAAPELRWATLAWFALGASLYFFEEYVTHVVVFHGVIPKHRYLYRLLYRLHLGHHDRPRRVDLLFTPLWYTVPMLLVNMLAFFWLTGSLSRTAALSAGLMAGYLGFEWCHLIVHSPHRPGRILEFIRRRHQGHHHWNEKRWYTISPPAVAFDWLFHTGGAVELAPRSKSPERSGIEEGDPRLVHARAVYDRRSDWTECESRLWQPLSLAGERADAGRT